MRRMPDILVLAFIICTRLKWPHGILIKYYMREDIPMKKRSISLVLFTALFISACSSSTSEAPIQPASVSQKNTETQPVSSDIAESVSLPEETETEEGQSGDITIEEKEIYNQGDIIITATGLKYDGLLGPEVTLLIENNTDTNITIQTRNSSVNGYMADLQMSCDIAAGKKANDGMAISTSELENCGIDTIANIEFSFHIFESDSWDTYADSEPIILTTSAGDNYQQVYDDGGDVLYDNNGIKIISKGLLTDDSFLGPQFLTYIENNSDQNITVQARDTSVNGFMVNPSMSAEVCSGKKSISSMTFLSSELEENEITEFENIETSFHIFYTDGWDTIADTEPITISFN